MDRGGKGTVFVTCETHLIMRVQIPYPNPVWYFTKDTSSECLHSGRPIKEDQGHFVQIPHRKIHYRLFT